MPTATKYNIYAYVNNEWVKVNEDLDGYTKSQTDTLLAAKADASGVYTKSEVDTILGDYYTQTQVDNLLDDKADSSTVSSLTTQVNTNTGDISSLQSGKADESTTYTKTEVDTALSAKANQSTTYTKTEVDTALGAKADSSDVYTKAQTYTQTEVDSAISTAFTNAELYQVVQSLPTENIKTNKIYLVRNSESASGNLYDLYLRVDNAWEKIDSIEINVADFATATDMAQAQSDITSLQTSKADASDVYTKSQVYTKTEADALLDDKADQSTTYTKTEVDTAVNAKANSSDVYTKSQTYTQTEVDTALALKANQSTTYTKTETDSAIATAVSGHNIVETVNSLPASGNARTLYLVPVTPSASE